MRIALMGGVQGAQGVAPAAAARPGG
jgi:hypothetical protein